MPSTDLATVNAADRAEFVRTVGPVFEHSPWIAGAVADATAVRQRGGAVASDVRGGA